MAKYRNLCSVKMDLGLYAVKNVVSAGVYDDFQQMQHLAFGGRVIEPGCAVLKFLSNVLPSNSVGQLLISP